MWCPDGYLTLDEIRRRILSICREYIYRHYLLDGVDLSRDAELPPGVSELAWATSGWLLVDFLRYGRWSVSSTGGSVVTVQLGSIVRGMEAHRRDADEIYRSAHYNPLISIGPPTKAWIDAYAKGCFEKPSFVNLNVGFVRLPSLLEGVRLLLPLIYATGIDRLAARFRLSDWLDAYWMAARFRGRALCMKILEFESLEKDLRTYLDALHGIDDSATPERETEHQKRAKGPGRTKEKRERIAEAALRHYGSSERTKSWKQVHREMLDILDDDFSLMSLKRAFADLKEAKEREQK